MGFPPLADSGNWNTAINLFKLQRETYYHYQQNSSKLQGDFRYQLIAYSGLSR
jgi:hypothetical protein